MTVTTIELFQLVVFRVHIGCISWRTMIPNRDSLSFSPAKSALRQGPLSVVSVTSAGRLTLGSVCIDLSRFPDPWTKVPATHVWRRNTRSRYAMLIYSPHSSTIDITRTIWGYFSTFSCLKRLDSFVPVSRHEDTLPAPSWSAVLLVASHALYPGATGLLLLNASNELFESSKKV
jgi:hypothetical protein